MNGIDFNLKSKLQNFNYQWLTLAMVTGILAALMISACATTRPSDDQVRQSIYELYEVNPNDINAPNSKGLTPLYSAVRFNDIDAVELFLSNPKINVYSKPYPILRAAYNGNALITQMLIDKGAQVDVRNKFGQTALMIATRRENVDVVALLLRAGAKPNAKDRLGSTPLMKAALKGNIEIANLLIEAGADLNETNRFGRNALIYATAKDRKNLAIGLIQPGTKVNVRDKKGRSPIFYAAQNGNVSLIKKLIQNGAEIDLKKKDKSALAVAAKKGHTEVVQALIQAAK